jgi:hypothetical protein
MRASSRVTIEATLAQHKKARRRRLSRGHSSFSLLLLLHHSPSADESRKEPLTANLDADQIALPQSVIVAIFVREQALRSIQIHRLQINGCSLLRAIIQNPIVHLEPVYSVLVECLGATSAKHKHDEGD